MWEIEYTWWKWIIVQSLNNKEAFGYRSITTEGSTYLDAVVDLRLRIEVPHLPNQTLFSPHNTHSLKSIPTCLQPAARSRIPVSLIQTITPYLKSSLFRTKMKTTPHQLNCTLLRAPHLVQDIPSTIDTTPSEISIPHSQAPMAILLLQERSDYGNWGNNFIS